MSGHSGTGELTVGAAAWILLFSMARMMVVRTLLSRTPCRVGIPLAPSCPLLRMAFPGAVVSTRFCLVAQGWPCNTPYLMSICSRNWNHCECTRTLQHVAMSRDIVENPSLQIGLFMCWRLRRRQSISSRWHRPAFVHHIWPRWKPNGTQVSFPTYPRT